MDREGSRKEEWRERGSEEGREEGENHITQGEGVSALSMFHSHRIKYY